MIVLHLPARRAAGGPAAAPAAGPAVYRLAGERLAANRPLAGLEPFRVGPAAGREERLVRPGAAAPAAVCPPAAGAWPGWDGEGWVGGVLRRVACREAPGGYDVVVEGSGRFRVAGDGGRVAWLAPEPGRDGEPAAGDAPPEPLLAAAVLGPVLALALALRGTYCLHASACRHPADNGTSAAGGGGVQAFLGTSGAGKSTLARELPRVPAGGWQRVADDLLPVRLEAGGLVALPAFPQLKLAPAEQFAGAGREPERAALAVTALHLLAGRGGEPAMGPEPGSATGPGPASAPGSASGSGLGSAPLAVAVCVPLGGPSAALALAAHTVAARLFPPALLQRHLAFCFAVAQRVPVGTLAVPPLPEHAASVAAALAADLSTRH